MLIFVNGFDSTLTPMPAATSAIKVKASGARWTMRGVTPGGKIAAMLPQNPVSNSIDMATNSSSSSIAGVIVLRATR